MSKVVRFELDLDNPPPLTEAQKAEIKALASMSDDDIDYSDIPPLTDSFWLNAKRNPYYRPIKQQLTLRIDADLIAWFKKRAEGGRGYQSNINQALREYMETHEGKVR